MEWYSPYYLFLLALVGLVVFLQLKPKGKRSPSILFSQLSKFTKSRGWRAKISRLPFWLQVIGLVLVCVALARPRSSDEKVKRNVEGIDIVVALDISESMLIEDMKPENRLESAKKTIKEFIEGRISDRIGLVLFSGESYTGVPITLDYKILLEKLATVQSTRSIKMGTAIGVALANSVGRLKDSTAKSRVVILLTDGENNSGTIDPETALEITKGYQVRVYTIGMGRDGQAQIPITYRDSRGNKRKRYYPIHSKVNDELLTRLAKETGGKYYRAINTKSLKDVFDEINSLEKTKVEVNKYVKYNELFWMYLVWGLLFFGSGYLLRHSILRRFE